MTTEQANERLVADLEAVVEDTEEYMRVTEGYGGEGDNELRNRLAATVESIKASCHRLEEGTVATVKATNRCIHEHPYETIGVAFGLGLLIGVLVGRR
jgi:ElaB/YqjD/DUF883 family membrane-anchored ribosome-binding protein